MAKRATAKLVRRALVALVGLATVTLGLAAVSPPAGALAGTISGYVVEPASTIAFGQVLTFDPAVSTTLEVHGNLIVEGTLVMRPNPGVVHKIVFAEAAESAFVGGSIEDEDHNLVPPATDVGLWVINHGRLDVAGEEKTAWTRLAVAPVAGATVIKLDATPMNWRVGDELRITPTGQGQYSEFESKTITAISGRDVTLSSALAYAHPSVSLPGGGVLQAEVLNLTRNVRIEGKQPASTLPRSAGANPEGRAHIFIENTVPVDQRFEFVALRFMGPRKYDPASGRSTFVRGRYALHFHHGFDNNVDTIVKGVVVSRSGSAAYVAHMTDRITFDNTISYDTYETPYWWDVRASEYEDPFITSDTTDETTYLQTIAAKVNSDGTGGAKTRLAGYSLACGTGNTVAGATAVGVMGSLQSSGFLWPEGANDCPNAWGFAYNVAHNNAVDGMFSWQNDADAHDVGASVAYRNGASGIEHGAYRNGFSYDGVILAENDIEPGPQNDGMGGIGEVNLHARSYSGAYKLDLTGLQVKTAFARVPALYSTDHRGTPSAPARLKSWTVTGPSTYAVVINEGTGSLEATKVDLICWTVQGGELDPVDVDVQSMNPLSTYRIQRKDGTAYQLLPNGTATTIAAFDTCT